MKYIIITTIITISGFTVSAFATIINIPDDYPTISEGLGHAVYGDTILVFPGVYNESFGIGIAKLTLASLFLLTGNESVIDSTIINGSIGFGIACDSVLLMGFTIQNAIGIGCLEAGPMIMHNIIRNHSGSGIYFGNPTGTPVVKHNIICGNSGRWGGGIQCQFGARPIIENNIICHNYASEYGGGISYSYYSGGTITNNVFYGNITEGYGGGLYCEESSPYITNSIFWHDSAGIGGDEIYIVSGSPTIDYCDIEGSGGYMDADPLFIDPQNEDFHLMSIGCGFPEDSPCIDAGEYFDEIIDCRWGLGNIFADIGAFGGNVGAQTGIYWNEPYRPTNYFLQNYPNPFNPSTTISYSLAEQSDVRIEIYNILGQLVTTLFDGNRQAGYHTVTWQADHYPSGVYFAKLKMGDHSQNIKMVLLK